MIDTFLKEIIDYSAGKLAENITIILSTKKYVNEFLIAKKIGLTINQTRNILYKLSDSGLVSSIRKKDKKKGWFTYFWKIEALKSLEFLSQVLLKQIEQINYQINSRESKQFYICERCNLELAEEKALLCNFICNECGEVFKIKDNSKLLRDFKRNLEKIKNKLSLINKEIEKEKEKIGKQKFKENKKLDEEKAEETRKKREAKKKLAKKDLKNKKPQKSKSVNHKGKKIKAKKKR
ncbi:MAG TPA: hypothetical protein VJA20_00560 [Candidatus Nanoarchaeia archaeon]|nr:hypothetical protein [Candidatus Nanoarchaeia archaeon]